MKKKKLEWYAFEEEFNKNELERINVLNEYFVEDLIKRIKKEKANTYEKVKDIVTRELKYRYWSKAEHEVIVHSLHYKSGRDYKFKIDVWYQLEPNIDRIVEYIIKELKIEVE